MLEQEHQIKINDLNISYKQIGNGDIPIVLLHGWGVSSDKYLLLGKYFSEVQSSKFKVQSHRIIIPDLPGFGKSDEPKENWNLNDYVEFVDGFVKKANKKGGFESVKNIILQKMQKGSMGLKPLWSQRNERHKQYGNTYYHTGNRIASKIILIGHSFGGRIAIKYAAKYPEKIDKLILTGAAGIKHPLNIKQKIIFILAKAGKKIFYMLEKIQSPAKANKRLFAFAGDWAFFSRKFLYKAAREKDYYEASPRMKEVMKNILAEDLTPLLDKIKTPTLLVWGLKDRSTPLFDGELMKSKIKGAKLLVVQGANHSLPYQMPDMFAEIVSEFIKK